MDELERLKMVTVVYQRLPVCCSRCFCIHPSTYLRSKLHRDSNDIHPTIIN